jgi:hypothetical protein
MGEAMVLTGQLEGERAAAIRQQTPVIGTQAIGYRGD